jgi:hypothetical protein
MRIDNVWDFRVLSRVFIVFLSIVGSFILFDTAAEAKVLVVDDTAYNAWVEEKKFFGGMLEEDKRSLTKVEFTWGKESGIIEVADNQSRGFQVKVKIGVPKNPNKVMFSVACSNPDLRFGFSTNSTTNRKSLVCSENYMRKGKYVSRKISLKEAEKKKNSISAYLPAPFFGTVKTLANNPREGLNFVEQTIEKNKGTRKWSGMNSLGARSDGETIVNFRGSTVEEMSSGVLEGRELSQNMKVSYYQKLM